MFKHIFVDSPFTATIVPTTTDPNCDQYKYSWPIDEESDCRGVWKLFAMYMAGKLTYLDKGMYVWACLLHILVCLSRNAKRLFMTTVNRGQRLRFSFGC